MEFSQGWYDMPKIYTVSEINHHMYGLIADDESIQNIMVSGELSNVKYHSSGHVYFTLKDARSRLSGIMFRSHVASGIKGTIKDGDKVNVTGSIQVYESGGAYQIYARRIEKEGLGLLYQQYEELKKKLSDMGMFDEQYKKEIPRYAMKVGIVTADTGEAVHDIIRNATRRNPHVSLLLCPARVQGEGAAESIAEAIMRLNEEDLDVIIVGRGGGSYEDLFCFSEEPVARAIFASDIPIVTGIGHEPDVSIADFVADKRASTPTAAAELSVFSYDEFKNELSKYEQRLEASLQRQVTEVINRLRDYKYLLERYGPEGRLHDTAQRLVEMSDRMDRAMNLSIRRDRDVLASASSSISRSMNFTISRSRDYLSSASDTISRSMDIKLERSKNEVARLALLLDSVSPVKKLASGYSYVADASGRNIKSSDEVEIGDELNIYLAKGEIEAKVTGKL